MERPIDLDAVIDFDFPLPESQASTIIEHPDLGKQCKGRVFTFPGHPGLLYIRRALSPDHQRRLCWQCWNEFPSPPAHTNFNRALGRSLPPDLWKAAQAGLRLGPVESKNQWVTNDQNNKNKNSTTNNRTNCIVDSCTSTQPQPSPPGPLASQLLNKLRWSSVGLIYDWTRRLYVADWGFMPLPKHLAQLALKLVALVEQIPTTPPPENVSNTISTANGTSENNNIQKRENLSPFVPDAALSNYYHEGDTLGGHIDDAEPDLSKPLVSLSLGRPGIFLVGGPWRC